MRTHMDLNCPLMPVDKLSIHSSTNFTESLSDASHCMVIISETKEDSSGDKMET